MSDAVTSHPSAQQLSAFGLGKLTEAEAEAVARHLGQCPDCLRAAQRVAADSFLGRVKHARPGGGTALPHKAAPRQAAAPAGQRPAAPAPALPPALRKHPKFRVPRPLGQGGMGSVYLAEHRIMERPVALKVVNKALLDNEEALARFRNEIKAAGKLKHDNIVAAYDAEQAGDLHLLVMEYVEGQSLAQVLERSGPLPVADSCRYAHQAALGLQHAHDQRMVHRDIKPQNLMVTREGRVKVLDFGLARLASERPRRGAVTVIGAYMGTPEYMAPEQALDARSADIRADIYSLGCTLYCLLAGRPPFAGETAVQQFNAHQSEEAAPLHAVRPEVPVGLSAVVARMLAKDPAARYQTPIEVARELAPFARRESRGAGAAPPLPQGTPSAARGTVTGTDTSKLPAAPRGASAANRPKSAVPAVPLAGGPSQGTRRQQAERSVPAAGPETVRGSGGRRGNRGRLLLAAGGAGMAALAGIIIIIIISREGPRSTTPAGPTAAAFTTRDREGRAPPPAASPTESKQLEDLLVAGSVWKGTFAFQDIDSKGQMELHVQERTGATFQGIHVARRDPSDKLYRYLRPVRGSVSGNILNYQATAPDLRFTVAATWKDNALEFLFSGTEGRVAKGKLEREALKPQSARVVLSVFNQGDDEGWHTLNHDDTPDATQPVEVRYTKGNYWLHTEGRPNGKEWGWHAPAKYHGDHSGKFGRCLIYELWTTHVGSVPATDWYVRLQGAGTTLYLNGTVLETPKANEWKTYHVPLDASGRWMRSGDGERATDEEIKNVLADVTDLRIKGEFRSPGNIGALDSIEFGAEDPFRPAKGN
jgi:tRNA A-37 threonylcarbamoyl transferase component Bud32